jgi:hypothetical protein
MGRREVWVSRLEIVEVGRWVIGRECFWRDWVEREVWKERDWRICFEVLDWREWMREVRLLSRSVSDITSESRREE